MWNKLGGHGIEHEIRSKLGEPIDTNGDRRTAIVMVANEGVMDLVLNWLCSANAINLDVSNVIIYVGTVESVAVIENASPGVHAIYSPILGSMPRKAAGKYWLYFTACTDCVTCTINANHCPPSFTV
jgi:hypothetical protein